MGELDQEMDWITEGTSLNERVRSSNGLNRERHWFKLKDNS